MSSSSVEPAPNYIDPEFAAIKDECDAQNVKLAALSFEDFVATWRVMPPALPGECPTDIEITDRTATVSDGSGIEIRIYKSKDVKPDAWLFLTCHGGGWTVGSHEVEGGNNRYVASKTGCVVVSPDYRMAPEYPFPYPINDCFDTLKWCKANAASLGINPEKIIIGGSSAGGNLTASVAMRARDEGVSGIRGQVLNIPNICHPKLFPKDKGYKYESTKEFEVCSMLNTKEMTWYWDKYLPNLDNSVRACPILAESFKDLPPALVQVAGMDPLRDEGFAYAKALKDDGVPVTEYFFAGLPHCFYFFPNLTKTAEYYANIVSWVKEVQNSIA
ncbi:hypothetical protein BP5796_04290 [Coleophoma crateriformis]|uniref:Alpha/beta hydrolase fold-3 domain-containing protein n=1 Tax=Coleophoma crateriformis TaxID=565419 RepID=A0A3D8SHY7_9HELO|nr:hypothetical protein BP5796_04290 [Coleophoma crateriformis]